MLYMWSSNATNNFFILQNLTTYFGLYGPSSGDNYLNDIQYVLFAVEWESSKQHVLNVITLVITCRWPVEAETCSEILKDKEVVSCVCGSHIYNFILHIYIVYYWSLLTEYRYKETLSSNAYIGNKCVCVVYIYIYICVCVCVEACWSRNNDSHRSVFPKCEMA
jgi:hypothetical protein